MALISFNDGSSINIIGLWAGREYISGTERDFIELVFDGETTTYDTVKALYDEPDLFKTIQCTETVDDGTCTTDYTDYIVPINIVSQNKENIFTISLRMARKTEAEKTNEELAQKNEEIQMALLELGTNCADLENRLHALESSIASSNN